MARNFATNPTAIWSDPGFLRLEPLEQRAYFLISTQPNITAAGTLPLTLRRWARLSAKGDVEQLRAALHGLARAGWVVIDEDTEELLLVPFIRDDKGYNNPKRRYTIVEAAADAVSATVRSALAVEFAALKLPTDGLTDHDGPPEPPKGVSAGDRLSDSRPIANPPGPAEQAADQVPWPTEPPDETGEPVDTGNPDTSAVDSESSQVNRLSDRRSQKTAPSNGSWVTQGPYVSGIQDPHSSSSSRDPAPPPPADRKSRRLVAQALGTDDDETRAVIDHIRRTHRPRNLVPYLRTMAGNGDLGEALEDVRAERARAAVTAQRRTQLAAAHEPPPDEPEVTPEQAAAARAQLRALLSGASPGGEPAALGTLLGRARPA